jgi:hypothetical protein
MRIGRMPSVMALVMAPEIQARWNRYEREDITSLESTCSF